jgi:transposase-like protein
MAKTTYSDETKAAALAALLAGQSISQVATEYHLPEGTVNSWRSRMKVTQTQGECINNASNALPKKEEIGNLILDYLKTNLDTLKIQAETLRDKQWILKQDAQSIAVLHGVMMDKAIRLLEAFGRGSENE